MILNNRHAIEADSMRKQIFRTDDISTVPVEVNRNVSTSEMHLFRTLYFVALENRPTTDVNKQLAFLKARGIDTKFSDIYSDTIKEVQKSLVHVLDEDLTCAVEKTKYYGIIVNESTDLSVHKKLIMYVRCICPIDIDVKTILLANVRIPDVTACTIVNEVLSEFLM